MQMCEAGAYATLSGTAASGVLVVCDHASNALPAEYGSLGLPAAELNRHIAWDIGASAVAHDVAHALGAPAVFTRYSRLLIDCNRAIDDPTLIMRLSDGAVVPGNRVLPPEERKLRIDRYYAPYHGEISRLIGLALAAGHPPVIVSIHSFTDVWRGSKRPWHCGVLWDKDPRLAGILLRGFKREQSLVVGDNEPYSGRLKGDCLWQHGTQRGLAHAIIEVRQDLIADEKGQREWGARIAAIVKDALSVPGTRADLQIVRHYGSHTD
jgi:predicted N-formylglutamate amidohydrolase